MLIISPQKLFIKKIIIVFFFYLVNARKFIKCQEMHSALYKNCLIILKCAKYGD